MNTTPIPIATEAATEATPQAPTLSVDALAAATPDSRDRMVDFLRAASMLVVCFGHWLMAVAVIEDGRLQGDNALAHIPGLWLVTWVLQVMPLFFLVGGFSHSVTLDACARRGEGYATFVRSRFQRILRPVLVLVAAWTVAALALGALGVGGPLLRTMTKAVTGPLWFIAVYLGVVALAPVMLGLHRRFGVRVVAVLASAVVLVDVARVGHDLTTVGALNLLFVWVLVHQIGFFYADGTLTALSRRFWTRAALAGLGALVLLTQVGPYPGSMVGMPGEKLSNMGPPTVCVLALTLFQVSLVMLARPALTRWLSGTGPWKSVIGASSVLMTVYCWHMTGLIAGVAVIHGLGISMPTVGTTAWWMTLPIWLVFLAALTAPLVAVFARWERPTGPVPTGGSTTAAALGAVALVVAFGGFAATGLAPLTAPATLIVWPVTPLVCAALLVVGLVLVGCMVRVRSPR